MKPNDKQLNAPVNFFKAIASRATSATTPNHIRIDFAPSADEVARKVYLNYGNQDSLPEDVLQHWQEAESQLLAEGNATRVYSIHKRPQLQLSRTTRHERINL
jgi:hypothetical protein